MSLIVVYNKKSMLMDEPEVMTIPIPRPQPPAAEKIYVTLIGAAPMASLDALMLSLERFKGILSSESAQTSFETTVRSILPDLKSVDAFIDRVYAVKDPRTSVTMTGRTLVVELVMSKRDFLECIQDVDIDEILKHVVAVGTLPAKKLPNQPQREYTVFPIRYINRQFVKTPYSGANR